MKKLRKISLDGLDYLSRNEKKKLLGGEDYSSVTFKTTPPPTTPPFSVVANSGDITGRYNIPINLGG